MKAISVPSDEATPSVCRRIDQTCDWFEDAWAAAASPRIEDYLNGWKPPESDILLQELILLELECRRRRGENCGEQEYLSRFPSLDRNWLSSAFMADAVGSSRVDLQACKLEYSIVSPK